MAEATTSNTGHAAQRWAMARGRWLAQARAGLPELVAVSLVALLLTGLLALRTDLFSSSHPIFAEPGWDHHAYIAMAEGNPFDFHLAPFGWRVLVPSLAAALPFSTSTSFFLVAFVSVSATTVVMYYVGSHAGQDRIYGLLAALLFLALGWAAKFVLMDYWLPDAAAFFAIALAVLLVARRAPLAFAVTLVLGVAGKESVIFVLPLWYTLQARRRWDPKLARETVLLGLPAIGVLLLLRVLIPGQNDDLEYVRTLSPILQEFRSYIPAYNYPDLLRDIGWEIRAHDRSSDTFLLYTSGTWGVPILALAAIGAVRAPLLALRLAPFLVLVYAQLLFAYNIERLLVCGFPAMIWLAIEGTRALINDARDVRTWAAIALAGGLVALNFRDPSNIPVGFELQAFLFIAFLAVVVGTRSWSSRPGTV